MFSPYPVTGALSLLLAALRATDHGRGCGPSLPWAATASRRAVGLSVRRGSTTRATSVVPTVDVQSRPASWRQVTPKDGRGGGRKGGLLFRLVVVRTAIKTSGGVAVYLEAPGHASASEASLCRRIRASGTGGLVALAAAVQGGLPLDAAWLPARITFATLACGPADEQTSLLAVRAAKALEVAAVGAS